MLRIALGYAMTAVSLYLSRCRRGGQLAAVAEPAHGSGRILIIASAGVEHPARAPQSSPSRWGAHRLAVPTAKAPRWAPAEPGRCPGSSPSRTTGLVNGVQDSSAIPANVTTHATTQLEAGVPFTSNSDS